MGISISCIPSSKAGRYFLTYIFLTYKFAKEPFVNHVICQFCKPYVKNLKIHYFLKNYRLYLAVIYKTKILNMFIIISAHVFTQN